MPLWNVGGITDMSGLFRGKTKFNEDISVDVSSVTTINHMFTGASPQPRSEHLGHEQDDRHGAVLQRRRRSTANFVVGRVLGDEHERDVLGRYQVQPRPERLNPIKVTSMYAMFHKAFVSMPTSRAGRP